MRAFDHRLPGQGRSQGRGRRGCAPSPWGFWGPEGQSYGGSNQNPHRSHEICAEADKKHFRAVGAPLTTWSRENNRTPVTIRGPSDSQSHHQWPFWISGPLWLSGALWLSEVLPTVRGPLIIRGHSEHLGPLTNRDPPNCQGPLNIRSPL